MIVIGLDLSLASTGWARIDTETRCAAVGQIVSKGRATATLGERRDRLERLAGQISGACDFADLIVIEGPSLEQRPQRGTFDRWGLWWMVVTNGFGDAADGVVEISPSSLKRYATGKGNASKDAVLAAVIRRYPDVEITGNDTADALVLAAMGARHVGRPIEPSLPAANLDAMEKVVWPIEAVPVEIEPAS